MVIKEGIDIKKYVPIGIQYIQDYNTKKFYKFLYIDYFLKDWFKSTDKSLAK